MREILVTKRDGGIEPLDLEKLHKVCIWATEETTGTSASEVEIKSHLQFYNKIKTSEIQETLIKSAADLITEETPNYQYVAGKLISYHLRKQVYSSYTPCHVKELVTKNAERGFYDSALLSKYSDDEWDIINNFIKHDRDENLTYVAMEQLRGKYLVQNRVTKEIYETPQIAYALIAVSLFSNYPKDTRLSWAKKYYDAISQHEISLPTPIMAGVRTSQRQFSSCVLIDCDDSLDSINATSSSIVKYVSQRAGIGVNAGKIRALGSAIRDGDAYHTGMIPFLKLFESSVNSCSQGGIRKGSATVYLPLWTYEIEDLLVLKNNKGVVENRVRNLDYSIQFNKLMYERLINGENITLFSPGDVPRLYDAFCSDQKLFKKLYEEAESSRSIRKKSVPAIELFSTFMQERKETGRIYLMNIDHANTHSSFIESEAPITMSNLCLSGETLIDICHYNELKAVRLKDIPFYQSEEDDLLIKTHNIDKNMDEYKPLHSWALTNANASDMYQISVGDNYIICTGDHQIYTEEKGYVKAKNLIKHELIKHNDRYVKAKVEKLETTMAVYDIRIDDDNHNFYANNILVHNCAEITIPTKPLVDIMSGTSEHKVKVKNSKVDEFTKYISTSDGKLFRDQEHKLYDITDNTSVLDPDYEYFNGIPVENEDAGAIALCTLSAVNWGVFKKPEDMERACTLAVRGLDALLDYQTYPVLAAELATLKRRPIGIGIINFAYFLAKNNKKYDDDALDLVDTWAQHWSYYIIKASADLAKENGCCPGSSETKYHQGILPVDTYKQEVDEILPHSDKVDWEGLRQQLKEHGMRNSTTCSLMPSETSSQVANATNGVEPPRSYVSIKQSKDGVLKQVVPEYRRLKNKYDLLWNQDSPVGYIKIMAILQKYIDQSISTNTSYNPLNYNDEQIPMSEMLQHLLLAYKLGLKTLYYFNTYDNQGEIDVTTVDDSEVCETCTI